MEEFLGTFWFNFIIQALGVLGIIANVVTFQMTNHKKTMIFKTTNETLFAVQYAMLGAYTGVAMNIVGSIRNIIFVEQVKRNKNTIPMRVVFSILFIVFMILTWAGIKSLLTGFAKVLSTVAYGSKNLTFMRICILVTSACWFAYNVMVGSYAGFICEALTIGSIIVSFVRDAVQRKKTQNELEQKTADEQ